ncbi:MAG: chemotaxis protein CheW [Halodesulfurarchaeum sp.]
MADDDRSVLEFSLGDGRYCIDISHVEEIVDADEDITPVPNAEEQVVGVVDLRGETTTIVDPTVNLDLEETTDGRRIIVLSSVEGTGLLIDDVHRVIEVEPESVDDSTASETTKGVLREEDGFVVWVEPDALV